MKPIIKEVTHVHPTAAGDDGSIGLHGLNPGTSYAVTYTKDGTPVSTTVTTDADGTAVIPSLNVGIYDSFVVTESIAAAAGENEPSDVHTGGISLFAPGASRSEEPAPHLPAPSLEKAGFSPVTNQQKIKDLLYSYFANTHGGDPKEDVKKAGEALIADLKTLKGDQKETCEILQLLYPDIIGIFGTQLEEMVTTMQEDFITRLGGDAEKK